MLLSETENPMSDDFCPRQIIFELPGNPGVLVTATERDGEIDFIIDVENTTSATGDLRALFFHFNEAKLPGLVISSSESLLTETRVQANRVLDLGDGATMAGAIKQGFDIGLEWGTPGGKKDDIDFPVTFTLSSATTDLTLDDFGGKLFGAKLDSVGGPGGLRKQTSKLTTTAPWAPDAKDDKFDIYEDGAAGLNSPSKTPQALIFDVTADHGYGPDFDGDGDPLTVVAIHDEDPHATIAITADGKISYTPDLDFSGLDTFEYCISDGHGGQDHAIVTVNVIAVADDPVITYTVLQGANINEMLVTVTAVQDDEDSSEFLDRIDVGSLPAGVTISPLGVNPGTEEDSINQQFLLTTPAKTDVDFDLLFTATSRETSNGDEEQATLAVPIEIEFTPHQTDLHFSTVNQSLWSSGPSEPFHFDELLGIENLSLDTEFIIPVSEFPPAWINVDTDGSLTLGFDTVIHLDAGNIDVALTVTTNIDTTYNKTTDTLFFDPTYTLKSGTFTTTGPSGYVDIDFVFDLDFDFSATLEPLDTILELVGLDGWADLSGGVPDYEPTRIDAIPFLEPGHLGTDSPDLPYEWPVLPGIVSVILDWPDLGLESNGSLAATDISNNFLTVNLDLEGAAITSFSLLAPIDNNIYNDNDFEWTDIDMFGGLNIVQDLLVELQGMTGILTLEGGGAPINFTFGTPPPFITNFSDHDTSGDGLVDLGFSIVPDSTLTNDTTIGLNLGLDVEVLKNVPILGGTAWDPDPIEVTIPLDALTLASGTFDITGFQAQSWDIFV